MKEVLNRESWDDVPVKPRQSQGAQEVAARLLDWYGRARRDLPWRAPPGSLADPYRVWLSEIMLQQTTVKAAIPYFEKFTARWPTVAALAEAPEDDILGAWAGLGYYARARNLMACARAIVREHGGRFPEGEAGLRALPGVGPYTAAAIAAIAFGRRASPVDGNIERVVARLFAVESPLPGAKAELRRLAATLAPEARAGDFAQAMMDLGATICAPRRPSCLACPLTDLCAARARNLADRLPARAPRPARPIRYGVAFLAPRSDGALLVRRRPPAGLLARMLEIPSSEWRDAESSLEEALSAAPFPADWRLLAGRVVHTFTHFRLEIRVCRADLPFKTAPSDIEGCFWLPRDSFETAALPSVMRKIAAHGWKAD